MVTQVRPSGGPTSCRKQLSRSNLSREGPKVKCDTSVTVSDVMDYRTITTFTDLEGCPIVVAGLHGGLCLGQGSHPGPT
jgi:hypothetical protein